MPKPHTNLGVYGANVVIFTFYLNQCKGKVMRKYQYPIPNFHFMRKSPIVFMTLELTFWNSHEIRCIRTKVKANISGGYAFNSVFDWTIRAERMYLHSPVGHGSSF